MKPEPMRPEEHEEFARVEATRAACKVGRCKYLRSAEQNPVANAGDCLGFHGVFKIEYGQLVLRYTQCGRFKAWIVRQGELAADRRQAERERRRVEERA